MIFFQAYLVPWVDLPSIKHQLNDYLSYKIYILLPEVTILPWKVWASRYWRILIDKRPSYNTHNRWKIYVNLKQPITFLVKGFSLSSCEEITVIDTCAAMNRRWTSSLNTDCVSNFRAFAGPPLIGLSSNFVGKSLWPSPLSPAPILI